MIDYFLNIVSIFESAVILYGANKQDNVENDYVANSHESIKKNVFAISLIWFAYSIISVFFHLNWEGQIVVFCLESFFSMLLFQNFNQLTTGVGESSHARRSRNHEIDNKTNLVIFIFTFFLFLIFTNPISSCIITVLILINVRKSQLFLSTMSILKKLSPDSRKILLFFNKTNNSTIVILLVLRSLPLFVCELGCHADGVYRNAFAASLFLLCSVH